MYTRFLDLARMPLQIPPRTNLHKVHVRLALYVDSRYPRLDLVSVATMTHRSWPETFFLQALISFVSSNAMRSARYPGPRSPGKGIRLPEMNFCGLATQASSVCSFQHVVLTNAEIHGVEHAYAADRPQGSSAVTHAGTAARRHGKAVLSRPSRVSVRETPRG